jgi:hypothetical protein
MTEPTAPTASQLSALAWVAVRHDVDDVPREYLTGTRPSTSTLRTLASRGYITASTAEGTLTPAGLAALGLHSEARSTQAEQLAQAVAAGDMSFDAAAAELLGGSAAAYEEQPQAPVPPAADEDRPASPVVATEGSTGFRDSAGAELNLGARVEIVAKGNNVRAKDVGAQGTITGQSRSRLKITWDAAIEDAPRWPVLPALVRVLRETD